MSAQLAVGITVIWICWKKMRQPDLIAPNGRRNDMGRSIQPNSVQGAIRDWIVPGKEFTSDDAFKMLVKKFPEFSKIYLRNITNNTLHYFRRRYGLRTASRRGLKTIFVMPEIEDVQQFEREISSL